MVHHVGILDGSGDAWGVRIPDLPGCYGGGASADAALSDAISAARDYADHIVRKGRALPAPRTLAEILADPDARPDLARSESVVLIPLVLDKGRSVRANVSLDAGLLEAIDEAAASLGLTRSAFLASAARDKLVLR
jgi:predicted RNase H-like HicB family nuclease